MREKNVKEGETCDYTNEKPDDVFRWLQKVITRKNDLHLSRISGIVPNKLYINSPGLFRRFHAKRSLQYFPAAIISPQDLRCPAQVSMADHKGTVEFFIEAVSLEPTLIGLGRFLPFVGLFIMSSQPFNQSQELCPKRFTE